MKTVCVICDKYLNSRYFWWVNYSKDRYKEEYLIFGKGESFILVKEVKWI